MKDFLLIIKTKGSVWTDLTPEQLQMHLEHGNTYIGKLIKDGKLKNANPVDKGSRIVTEENGVLKESNYDNSGEMVAGYFHITANDANEAVAIAKENPIFQDISTKIEVHPLMAIGG